MAKLNEVEFRAFCGGVTADVLRTERSKKRCVRKKVRGGGPRDYEWDTEHPLNAKYVIAKRSSKGEPISVEKMLEIDRFEREKKKKTNPSKNQPETVEKNPDSTKSETLHTIQPQSKGFISDLPQISAQSSVTEIDKAKKLADLRRTLKAEELDNLKIQKMMGELVPVDLVVDVISRFRMSSATLYKGLVEQMVSDMGNELSAERETMSFYRKKIVDELNKGIDENHENFVFEMDSLVKAYSTKRGVGERK